MGIGSILGSIAGLGLAPFTGGASMIPTLMGAGGALGGLADVFGGAAKSGQAQNNTGDQLKIALENAKLNRDKFATAAPGERLSTGIRASLASNFKPSTLDWGPNGFKPGAIAAGKAPLPVARGGFSEGMANLNPDTKALANQITHDELVSQMRGGETGGGNGPGTPYSHPDSTGTDKAMPTGIGDTSTGDKVLGGLGMGSSLLAILAKAMKGAGGGNDTGDYVVPGQTQPWDVTGIG